MNDQNNQKLPTWEEFQNELIVRALKDESFRQELLANPKAVVETEMGKFMGGAKLPDSLEVRVIEQPANELYLVLPAITDELDDEALDSVAGGFCNEIPRGEPAKPGTGCYSAIGGCLSK